MCLDVLIFKQDEMGIIQWFQSLVSRQNERNNHGKFRDTNSIPLATILESFPDQVETRRRKEAEGPPAFPSTQGKDFKGILKHSNVFLPAPHSPETLASKLGFVLAFRPGLGSFLYFSSISLLIFR